LCQRSGFSLEEIRELMQRRHGAAWKVLAREKLDNVESRIASLEQARDGLRHALDCSNPDIMRCDHFRSRLDAIYPAAS
jgi:DNA-binding transcriptional MerR regulator